MDLNHVFERFQRLQILMILSHQHQSQQLEPHEDLHFVPLATFFLQQLFQICHFQFLIFLQ